MSPELCPITRALRALHERFVPLEEGRVATYIPELARAEPGWFGISLATADGYVYEVGNTRRPFTIQSISKPFVYGLALEDRGKSAVLERIGVEPTGDAFNEISLESSTGRPRNPMINAGAITATSLVAGDSPEDRWGRSLVRLLEEAGAANAALKPAVFDTLDAAVEWCEGALLTAHGLAAEAQEELPLAKHDLLRGLDADQLELLTSLLERRCFGAREMLVSRDDPGDELFLLVQGDLSVLTDLPDGRLRRLATLSPGMGFGEPSMVESAARTAFVRADRPSVCWVLKRATFDSLEASCPALKIRLLENLLRSATKTMGRLSFEVAADRL